MERTTIGKEITFTQVSILAYAALQMLAPRCSNKDVSTEVISRVAISSQR